jgi:peptidoglycan/xylan/chitin deacetylase (PgdA/CDA1 family)
METGPLSSLPVPEGDDVPRPSGDPGTLQVLDWAGFESAVSYTFDDSHPSHLAHYDTLQATGVDVTFYLSSALDADGFRAGWQQVAADGHEIGNHTVSHPHADLTGSVFGDPLESRAAEVEQCSEYITEILGQRDVWTMAGPFGDEGWSDAARDADLFLNRGVGGGAIAPNDDTDPYDLPSYMAGDSETADAFDAEVDSARSDGEWLVLLFHSIAPTDADHSAAVDGGEITASIEHAKSFGDVWIDTS